jgi:apolipoprotein N-acyltransferase
MHHRDYPWSPLSLLGVGVWSVVAAASLIAAFEVDVLSPAIVLYVFVVVQLTRAPTAPLAFFSGLAVGYATFAVELWFLVGIFGPFALMLFLVAASWTAMFVLLGREMLLAFGSRVAIVLLPMLWIALEYTRCELYWLKFSWLAPGFALNRFGELVFLPQLGVYGFGFAFALVGVCLWQLRPKFAAIAGSAFVLAIGAILALSTIRISGGKIREPDPRAPLIAGVQLEAPTLGRVLAALDEVVAKHPDVELIVLSEYTFEWEVPEEVCAWCRRHGKYLIAGGRDTAMSEEQDFYNTAYVIDPNGRDVFSQYKSVPIQFFRDGNPARSQRVWESPWGKIGICICYDLSFTRVTDEFISKGAELLIVPTMDVTRWGRRQHELHAMIAPTRAAEYGVPIVRVASSGISQVVDASGYVKASLPFPGQGEYFAERVRLDGAGRIPPDRSLAWIGIAVSALATLGVVWRRRTERIAAKRQNPRVFSTPHLT